MIKLSWEHPYRHSQGHFHGESRFVQVDSEDETTIVTNKVMGSFSFPDVLVT